MEKLQKRVAAIVQRAQLQGISPEDLKQFESIRKYVNPKKPRKISKIEITGLIILLFFLGFGYFYLKADRCLIEVPGSIFREPENCNLCSEINEINRIKNITPEEFEMKYAYSGHPVIVTDGTKDWSKLETFTFEFFKEKFQYQKDDCQFFPYLTNFKSLSEALEVDPDRKSWYIGWSSCDSEITNELRNYYKRPYFLPKYSRSTSFDWIFMGTPGKGAHLHLDNVEYPSWQAQLSGQKMWRLVPPPECYFWCKEHNVVVNPGEIIVVDTNRWYHQTFIVSKNLSITIGSEFD